MRSGSLSQNQLIVPADRCDLRNQQNWGESWGGSDRVCPTGIQDWSSRLSRNYRCASRLNEAAVVRMPSVYGVPAKPNSLANLLESKRYGPSLWYSIS